MGKALAPVFSGVALDQSPAGKPRWLLCPRHRAVVDVGTYRMYITRPTCEERLGLLHVS